MPEARKTTDLVAHSKALEAAGTAISLVMQVPSPLKSIADQLIRSASSVPANPAEGHGRLGAPASQVFQAGALAACQHDAENSSTPTGHARHPSVNGCVSRCSPESFPPSSTEVRACTSITSSRDPT